MSASFASPLYWQVQYAVQNTLSNKKMYKQGVTEVQNLVSLFGDDARLFLLQCLIEQIDFREKSSSHSNLVQFLSEELDAHINDANFGTLFSQALLHKRQKGDVTKAYLEQFCKTLKMKLLTQLRIGTSIVGCTDEEIRIEGRRFLAARAVEIGSAEVAALPDGLLHEMAFHLKSNAPGVSKEGADAADAIVNARVRQKQEAGHIVGLEPLLESKMREMKEQVALDETRIKMTLQNQINAIGGSTACSARDTVTDADFMEGLLSAQSRAVAGVVRDVGYAATESADAFRKVLAAANVTSVTTHEAAALVSTMALTQNELDDEFAPNLYSSLVGLGEEHIKDEERKPIGEWNPSVLVAVLSGDIGAGITSWDDIIKALDTDQRTQYSAKGFEFIVCCYMEATSNPLPAKLLLGRWHNTDAQFSLLRCALQTDERVDWTEDGTGPNRQDVVHGSPSSLSKNVFAWCSIDLVGTLLELAQTDLHRSVQSLFEYPLVNCPDLLLTALCRLRPLWPDVKEQLLLNLFPKVLENESAFVGNVLKSAWEADKDAVVSAFVRFYKSGPPGHTVPRIIKFAERFEPANNALYYLLEADNVSFAVEMASSAASRDVINLAKWLQNRVATSGDKFGETCIDHLHGKLRFRKSETAMSISPQTIFAFITTLETLPGHADSPLKLKTKQLKAFAQSCYPQEFGSNSAQVEHGKSGNSMPQVPPTDNGIEEEANAYFQKIFTSKSSISDVVEMLKRFKSSGEEREKKIFGCMVGNLLDEYRFFHKYPEKELRITGRLFGTLINENLLDNTTLGTALRKVLEAIQKAPKMGHNNKMFTFGCLALDQFKGRLREWPEYSQALVSIPQLKNAHPDWVAEISTFVLAAPHPQGITPSTNGSAENTATNTADSVNSLLPSMESLKMATGEGLKFSTGPKSIKDMFQGQIERPTPTAPPQDVIDALQFVANNLSIQNLGSKLKEVNDVLKPEFTAWFADFLVQKRVIAQANFHKLYLLFIEKLGRQDLDDEVLEISYHRARALLSKENIGSDANDRSVLKNLGNYIGIATLGRNKPVLFKDLNLKELLYLSYEEGKLIAIAPFVAKILEGAKSSDIFLPPNPWLMALMNAMRELYDVPDLKLKLKFEVEVLCKHLGLVVEHMTPSIYLSGRRRPNMRDNPDFNAKAVEKAMAEEAAAEKLKDEQKVQDGATGEGSTVIPNLATYVTIHSSLNIHELQGEASLSRLVPLALDRAIREIIQPVIERSVTIACITSNDLVVKDFAMEWDEAKMRKAAHLMVSNLAGNLALVTCKDPLRNSMTNNLRIFLQQQIVKQQLGAKISPDHVEGIVQKCVGDNLDLGCMLIVKAATEKAMRDIDERLRGSYEIRRNTREQNGQQYYDMSIFNGRNRYPSALPEVLRPQPGGLQKHQYMVYSMFQQMPRRNIEPGDGSHMAPTDGGAGAVVDKLEATPANNPSMAAAAAAKFAPPHSGDMDMGSAQALERIFSCMSQLDGVIQQFGAQIAGNLDRIPANHPVQPIVVNVARVIQMTVVQERETTVLNFAQQVVTRLFERAQDPVTIRLYMACVAAVKTYCKPLVATLTNWVIASNFMDLEVIPELVRVQLLNTSDFDTYIFNLMRKGDVRAVPFAKAFLQIVVLDKKIADVSTFGRTASVLQNFSMNTEAYPELQQFMTELGRAASSRSSAQIHGGAVFRIMSQPTVPGQREELTRLLIDWTIVVDKNKAETSYIQLLNMLQSRGILKDDESTAVFFRICTEICIERYLMEKTFNTIDAFTKLVVLLIKFSTPRQQNSQIMFMNKILLIISQVMAWQADESTRRVQVAMGHKGSGGIAEDQGIHIATSTFDQKPYFRLFVALLQDLSVPDPALAAGVSSDVVLQFATTFHALRPQRIPGFAFAWLELISHRCLVSNLLSTRRDMKYWESMKVLVVDLLQYMEPHLRTLDLHDSIRMMYKGLLRFLLVLLHDFPQFFCDYHFVLCNNIPTTCIQLRNLILSAFPSNLRLPDPFSPNLKIDTLPGIQQPPSGFVLAAHAKILERCNLLEDLDAHLKHGGSSIFMNSVTKLVLLPPEQQLHTRFNTPVINALVLYAGAIASSSPGSSVERQSAVTLFMKLLRDLDTEGRYLLLNAIANQLRYPNLHTYYFSCVLLYLFGDAGQEVKLKEQITRVLLERLIVHRPHPWGLLITFIELIKNQRYNFWTHEFTQCHPDISRLFESVASSCIKRPNGQQQNGNGPQ